jgi:hypothetical protein
MRHLNEDIMTTTSPGNTSAGRRTEVDTDLRPNRVRGDETKPSWKTTELAVYVLAVIGVLIASQAVGDGSSENGGDYFAADKAWWFITLLTVGYLVSRGLAKSGSRANDVDSRNR